MLRLRGPILFCLWSWLKIKMQGGKTIHTSECTQANIPSAWLAGECVNVSPLTCRQRWGHIQSILPFKEDSLTRSEVP